VICQDRSQEYPGFRTKSIASAPGQSGARIDGSLGSRPLIKRLTMARSQSQKVETVHQMARGGVVGNRVQCGYQRATTIENRGEKLYPIAMIDDATSELLAQGDTLPRAQSPIANMRLLWSLI